MALAAGSGGHGTPPLWDSTKIAKGAEVTECLWKFLPGALQGSLCQAKS